MATKEEVLHHAANLERYRRLLWMDLTDAERIRVEKLFAQERAIMENLRARTAYQRCADSARPDRWR